MSTTDMIDYGNIDYNALDEDALNRSRIILEQLFFRDTSEELTLKIHNWLYANMDRKETEVALWEMFNKVIAMENRQDREDGWDGFEVLMRDMDFGETEAETEPRTKIVKKTVLA